MAPGESEQLRLIAAAHERVERTVAAMTDDEARGPSLLPGWNRAALVTHIARNADSNARMIAARLRGEERAQYPGGPDQRQADIDAGRDRSPAELLADLRAADEELMAAFAAVGADDWDLLVPAGIGPRPVRQRLSSRLVETEVHHADLGLAYTWRDWAPELVAEQLPRRVEAIGAMPPPAAARGRWVVATPSQTWAIDVVDDVAVMRAAGTASYDGRVRGPEGALYAWLVGRATADEAGLDVDEDSRVADLPSWFPWS